jgi:hypothetical protein
LNPEVDYEAAVLAVNEVREVVPFCATHVVWKTREKFPQQAGKNCHVESQLIERDASPWRQIARRAPTVSGNAATLPDPLNLSKAP